MPFGVVLHVLAGIIVLAFTAAIDGTTLGYVLGALLILNGIARYALTRKA
jgi:uncharacterized membrane protein HdeD (DUF308 family)